MTDELSLDELKQLRKQRKPATYDRKRCKRCPIKLIHDGVAYRHVDERYSGERKHGHYPEPRRERGTSNK
jgi:hypothetical protein